MPVYLPDMTADGLDVVVKDKTWASEMDSDSALPAIY